MQINEYAEQLRAAVRNIPDFPNPGIQFKDITPILGEWNLLRMAVDALAEPYADLEITKVLGVEARGFILGSMLAHNLGAGFVPVRKKGKLPYRTLSATYDLEYGKDCIEMHEDAISAGDRILIHDDVIATGGTAAAASELVRMAGAEVVGFSFLVELSFLSGRSALKDAPRVHSVILF